MAVVKLSKSGKQVQFVDAEGNVFGTSSEAVRELLGASGLFRGKPFILLVRMPFSVDPFRFGKSLLWDGEKTVIDDGQKIVASKESLDAFSKAGMKSGEMLKSFKDKKVKVVKSEF